MREQFDRTGFVRAAKSDEPAELNRVKAVERGLDQLFNYVAELAALGLELAGLRRPEDHRNMRQDVRRLRDLDVLGAHFCDQLVRVAAVRNRLVHDYVGVAAEDVHEAARLLLAALPGFVSGYQDWVRAEFHPASNRQPDGRGPPETQVYLGDDELELLDRVARATGASRSELIRRAVRSTFGEQTRGERLHALDASAGSWSGRRLTGAEYVDTLRGDINKRLRRLGVRVKLVDTSVAIDHLRGEQAAVDLLKRLIGGQEPVVASEVVRFELLAGVRDDELEALEQFRWSRVSSLPTERRPSAVGASLHRYGEAEPQRPLPLRLRPQGEALLRYAARSVRAQPRTCRAEPPRGRGREHARQPRPARGGRPLLRVGPSAGGRPDARHAAADTALARARSTDRRARRRRSRRRQAGAAGRDRQARHPRASRAPCPRACGTRRGGQDQRRTRCGRPDRSLCRVAGTGTCQPARGRRARRRRRADARWIEARSVARRVSRVTLHTLFEDRERPFYGQARPVQLTPLRDDDLADYLSRRFSETGRKVDEALDLLLDFAAGHPQRAMLIAHYLWEHTDPGETADETSFAAAIEAVHDEVADQLASLWGGFDDSERRAIAAVAANPAGPLRKETLEPLGLPRATGRDALARLERAGHLLTDGEVVPVHRSTAGPLGGKRPPGADLNGTTVSSPRRQEIIGASAGGLPVLT